MTLRLCFLGNSHVAALREAWTGRGDRWPGVEAHFVGAHKDLLLKTALRDGHLEPASAAAAHAFDTLSCVPSVDMAGYDAFVLTGCLVSLHNATLTYRDARWVGLPSLSGSPDLAAGPQRLLSYAAARASVVSGLSSRLGVRLAAHLRPMTDRPIYLTSQPRVKATIKARPRAAARVHNTILENGDAAEVSALYEDAAERAMAEVGALYLPQPPQTIEDHILTAERYMTGAKRLTAAGRAAQPSEDITHANAAYGRLVIGQVISRVRALQPA